jgi:hypothetical protein
VLSTALAARILNNSPGVKSATIGPIHFASSLFSLSLFASCTYILRVSLMNKDIYSKLIYLFPPPPPHRGRIKKAAGLH